MCLKNVELDHLHDNSMLCTVQQPHGIAIQDLPLDNGVFFIPSGYFYSNSSSPLLLRGAPNYSIDTVLELTCQSATGNCERRTCPKFLHDGWSGNRTCDPRMQGTELTTERPRPTVLYALVSQHELAGIVDLNSVHCLVDLEF